MNDRLTDPARFLPKNKWLYFQLIDRIVNSEFSRLPLGREAAEEFEVNVNTVKSVYADLAEQGFIETRRRAGTLIATSYTQEQVKTYRAGRNQVKNLLQTLDFAGFSADEIVAFMLSVLADFSSGEKGVIYVENDYYELLIGKQELEQALGVPVIPLYRDDVVGRLNAGRLEADLIVTTFYCEQELRRAAGRIPVLPLQITPPLEQLLNFALIPRDTSIALVVISEQIKRRVAGMYPNIVKDFPGFRILTLNEALEDRNLLVDVGILLTLKLLYRENAELFQHVPQIVTYNRFQDDEGLNQIRSML